VYNEDTGRFFFIEMNTRIQVEHPITDDSWRRSGREMIRIAQGQPLGLAQADIETRGAAIEVRINAEDPDKNFSSMPRARSARSRSREGQGARRYNA